MYDDEVKLPESTPLSVARLTCIQDFYAIKINILSVIFLPFLLHKFTNPIFFDDDKTIIMSSRTKQQTKLLTVL